MHTHSFTRITLQTSCGRFPYPTEGLEYLQNTAQNATNDATNEDQDLKVQVQVQAEETKDVDVGINIEVQGNEGAEAGVALAAVNENVQFGGEVDGLAVVVSVLAVADVVTVGDFISDLEDDNDTSEVEDVDTNLDVDGGEFNIDELVLVLVGCDAVDLAVVGNLLPDAANLDVDVNVEQKVGALGIELVAPGNNVGFAVERLAIVSSNAGTVRVRFGAASNELVSGADGGAGDAGECEDGEEQGDDGCEFAHCCLVVAVVDWG